MRNFKTQRFEETDTTIRIVTPNVTIELFRTLNFGTLLPNSDWKINWACYGSVSPEFAREFIDVLNYAIEICEMKNHKK